MTAPYEPRRGVVDPSAPPMRAAPERRWWGPIVWNPGLVLGALGTICFVVSLFVPWRTPSLHPSDIPVAFLWNKGTTASDPSLLIFLIPIAIILIVGTVSALGRGLRAFRAIGAFERRDG